MQEQDFELTGLDGQSFACSEWRPGSRVRACVQIAHGMGEHRRRYRDFAEALTVRGYAVYASDHRGHGDTMRPGEPGAMGDQGWRHTLADMHELGRHIRAEHKGRRLALFGHSMGAMLTQQYLTLYGRDIDAALLSGSPGFSALPRLLVTELLARIEALRCGRDGQSALLQNLLFARANDDFDGPDASGFEWLSRDEEAVAKYLSDPQCGFVLSPRSLAEMFAGSRQAQSRRAVSAIPANLPLYVVSGSEDPVHNEETGLVRMVDCYRAAGLAVDYKLWIDGRHEMLNETNRVDVVAHLLDWLDATLLGD